jgi:hypothetical protein
MTTEQIAVGLGGASALAALWAAVFATRADRAARNARATAERRWDEMVRPRPRFTFVAPPALGQPIEVEVENLGGALAAGAVIAEYGDDIFASELTLPDKAPPRRILLPPVIKAWQKANQPQFLMVAGRDLSGRWWDCLNGGKLIKEPRRWVDAQLRNLRLQGAVSFPELSGSPSAKR